MSSGRGHHGPALKSGDCLDRAEAEAGDVTERAHPASGAERPERMRSVLDHPQAVISRDAQQCVELTRQTEVVDRQNGARPLGDQRAHLLRIDAQIARFDVAHDDVGARAADGLVAGDVGEGRADHLVPGPEADQAGRDVQRLSARVRRDHMAIVAAEEPLDPPLELLAERPHAQPAGLECRARGLLHLPAQVRLVVTGMAVGAATSLPSFMLVPPASEKRPTHGPSSTR